MSFGEAREVLFREVSFKKLTSQNGAVCLQKETAASQLISGRFYVKIFVIDHLTCVLCQQSGDQ